MFYCILSLFALKAHVGHALPTEVLHGGLLRPEHKSLGFRIPEPHHQHLLTIQLKQHGHVAVAVTVPVGEVDAPELLPRVALQRDGIVHIVVYGIRLVVVAEVGTVRVDAHQHVDIPAVTGDAAAVPDNAGHAPVVAHHIIGVVILVAAGGKRQRHQQRQYNCKSLFHTSLPFRSAYAIF